MDIRNAFELVSTAPCETCPILKDSLCLPLPAKQRNILRAMASGCLVPQGKVIFNEGDEVTSFASILTGVVKLFKEAPGGEQVVAFRYPPELLGYTFDNVHIYSAVAATEVELCIYPQAPFRAILDKSRQLSRRILEVKSNELEFGARMDGDAWPQILLSAGCRPSRHVCATCPAARRRGAAISATGQARGSRGLSGPHARNRVQEHHNTQAKELDRVAVRARGCRAQHRQSPGRSGHVN